MFLLVQHRKGRLLKRKGIAKCEENIAMRRLMTILCLMLTVAMIVGMNLKPEREAKAMENPTENKHELKAATFAGGCFWCVEADFEKVSGVVRVISGYTGGHTENPTYRQVTTGKTGHVEAVQVTYDPQKVVYEDLLEIFWRHVDPTDSGGQFVDRGAQYATAIFYHDEEQRRLAEESKRRLDASGRFKKPIVTPILPLTHFYQAEDYHQSYHRKNPLSYTTYRMNSGRDSFLTGVWKDSELSGMKPASSKAYVRPGEDELRRKLTPLQYRVTQEDGTEPAFNNEFWDYKEEGIYVDIVSGEPLFSSVDKFDSGTGWPSFSRPLVEGNVVEKKEHRFFAVYREVRIDILPGLKAADS